MSLNDLLNPSPWVAFAIVGAALTGLYCLLLRRTWKRDTEQAKGLLAVTAIKLTQTVVAYSLCTAMLATYLDRGHTLWHSFMVSVWVVAVWTLVDTARILIGRALIERRTRQILRAGVEDIITASRSKERS